MSTIKTHFMRNKKKPCLHHKEVLFTGKRSLVYDANKASFYHGCKMLVIRRLQKRNRQTSDGYRTITLRTLPSAVFTMLMPRVMAFFLMPLMPNAAGMPSAAVAVTGRMAVS